MINYYVRQYEKEDFSLWNAFIEASKNATFLFHRDFMEYHNDKFHDFSLLIFKKEKLIAVLPANKIKNEVYSHQGLTYGGLIFIENFGAEIIENFFLTVISFIKNNGFSAFYYKKMPEFYAHYLTNQMDYFLNNQKAILLNRNMNLAVNYSKPLQIAKSKLKHFKNSYKHDLVLIEENNLDKFWNSVLIPRLKERHNAKPVHTLEEITLLKVKFPDNIKQFNVYHQTELVAGITLFCSKNIVKSQYGATTVLGEKLRALDFAFIKLIEDYKDKMHFFDMGTVGNYDGSYNKGLLKQKEELGCEIYTLDTYKIVL